MGHQKTRLLENFPKLHSKIQVIVSLLLPLGISLSLLGCGGTGLINQDEIAQSIVEAMVSLDETFQASPFADLTGEGAPGSCYNESHSGCTSARRTLKFDECIYDSKITASGNIAFSFDNPVCSFSLSGDVVGRTSELVLTDPARGTIQITNSAGGELLIWTGGETFSYTVGGIRRTLSLRGQTQADLIVKTTSAAKVTGGDRSNRVLEGGTFLVTHLLQKYSVTLSENQLFWEPACTCPTSGSLSGSVTSGQGNGRAVKIEMTGCGVGRVTVRKPDSNQTTSTSVSFERCTKLF